MKKLNIVLLYVKLFLFLSCSNTVDKNIPKNLFNIQNVNNIRVTSFDDENLKGQGYNREIADILIYENKENDTITQLAFDNNLGKLTYKTWYINLKKTNDKRVVNGIMYKHGILMMSDFTYCSGDKESYFFPAMNNSKNIIYLCKVYKDEDDYILRITYHNEIRGLNDKEPDGVDL